MRKKTEKIFRSIRLLLSMFFLVCLGSTVAMAAGFSHCLPDANNQSGWDISNTGNNSITYQIPRVTWRLSLIIGEPEAIILINPGEYITILPNERAFIILNVTNIMEEGYQDIVFNPAELPTSSDSGDDHADDSSAASNSDSSDDHADAHDSGKDADDEGVSKRTRTLVVSTAIPVKHLSCSSDN